MAHLKRRRLIPSFDYGYLVRDSAGSPTWEPAFFFAYIIFRYAKTLLQFVGVFISTHSASIFEILETLRQAQGKHTFLLFRSLSPLRVWGNRVQYRISTIIPPRRYVGGSPIQFVYSYEIHKRISIELFHEQLPLPVPCYDLLPITELAVGRLSGLRALPALLS